MRRSDERGYQRNEDAMREDIISNTLVWVLAKIVNFISAGDELELDGPSDPHSQYALGVPQQILLERWRFLSAELDRWFQGLPDTFKPCARVEPSAGRASQPPDAASSFAEVWYSMPMCASAMQNYHFAKILLLVNKPHESTARRSTVTDRLKSYRSIADEIKYHSHEICGISLARPDGSVRVHATHPLFVAGQCLTETSERQVVLDLLRGIEKDLGWATAFREKQLLDEWNWSK